MDVMDDKKAIKKAKLRKRNKKDFILRKMIEDRKRENERAERDEELKEKSLKASYSVPGSPNEKGEAKATEFRNRITGKKRASKERWNRFAGTTSSGGRGL